ncbi:hypothetical protein GCM10009841_03900 [Microlunatus panaciterrae]|uniref:Uncharacterized protein n=1 Tax=Microlunatus panaciterrae TaxID=400768 RepID=A0ABS2RIY3_9ACTN|nr:hypothetical protein [Microlunatus panaciterrae]MBM7798950.1 hypothetical protein [Microlunatus panaciterrae]
MTIVDDILAALGLAKVPGTARNLLRWPVPPTPPAPRPPLVEGVLAHLRGDLTTDSSLRPRVSFILGPGATLGGVVAELTDLLATITTRTTAAPIPDRGTVGAALQTYSATHLTNTPTDVLKVGFRMPLPIEIDEDTGEWVTNLETIRDWAQVPPTIVLPAGVVGPLLIPDPDALRAEVAADLAAVADASDLGIALAARALRNPYEPVFFAYELFDQVRRLRAAEEVPLALELVDSLVNHQAQLLASTTAGNAVLRRLWFAVESVDAATLVGDPRDSLLRGRRLLATALGLAATVPPVLDTWQSPLVAGPSITPREAPLPAANVNFAAANAPAGSETAIEAAGNNQQVVLGRQLSAGNTGVYDGYTGPAHIGRVLPAAFVAAHQVEINPAGDPRLDARSQIVVAIAPNEGRLDAARLRDRGMLSTGLQQWTEHVNTEANVLWEHFRGLAPDQYDLHFGLYRLYPQIWGALEAAATPVPSAAALAAANPWADPAVTADPLALPAAPVDHFPLYATLYELVLNGRVRMHQSTAANIGPRFAFFKGSGPAGARVFTAEWGARARLAARTSVAYCVAEMQTANKRFDRILRDTGDFLIPGTPAPLGGGPLPRYTAADLFTTQYGAALVLDHHINAPGLVTGDITDAVNTTTAVSGQAAFDAAGNLRDPWVVALASRYQVVRHFPGPGAKAQRDGFINGLPAAVLSRAAGSFAGW